MRAVLVLAVTAACTPRAITPPVRTFIPDSPAVPAAGHSDVALGLGVGGSTDIWGPGGALYAARARETIQQDLAVEVEGGVISVNDEAGQNRDDNAYTGRVGILKSYEQWFALTAGVGGGLSSVAGNWGSADAGFVVGGTNRWVRPLLAFSVGYAAPTGHKTFTVTSDNETTTLQLPRNGFARLDLGLEIGPRGAFLLGMSYMDFLEYTPDVVGDTTQNPNQSYFTLGLAARIPL